MTEFLPPCFSTSLGGPSSLVGPGVVVLEAERSPRRAEEALPRLAQRAESMSAELAVILVAAEDGWDLAALQGLHATLAKGLSARMPTAGLVLACATFDEAACTARVALLGPREPSAAPKLRGRGAAASEDNEEEGASERGRTQSRGTSGTRRGHAPTRPTAEGTDWAGARI